MCHCGAVVKELLARADKRGSTPSTLFSVSLYRFFFSVWSLFLTLFFLLPCFPLFLMLTLLIMHIDQYIFYV